MAYLLISKKKPAQTIVPQKAWLVDTIILMPETHTPKLKLFGKVESAVVTTVESTLAADVTEVNISEGQMVKKGQLLMALDDREVQFVLAQRDADVKELEAKIKSERLKFEANKNSLEHEQELIDLAKVSVDRMQKLVERRAASAAQFDQATEEFSRRMLQFTNRQLQVADFENQLQLT